MKIATILSLQVGIILSQFCHMNCSPPTPLNKFCNGHFLWTNNAGGSHTPSFVHASGRDQPNHRLRSKVNNVMSLRSYCHSNFCDIIVEVQRCTFTLECSSDCYLPWCSDTLLWRTTRLGSLSLFKCEYFDKLFFFFGKFEKWFWWS